MTDLILQTTAITFKGDLMGAETEEDLYAILGLESDASEKEVKKNARSLMAEYHPDTGGDTDSYKTIAEVRKILTGEHIDEVYRNMEEYSLWKEAERFFDESHVDDRAVSVTERLRRKVEAKKHSSRIEQIIDDKDKNEGSNYREKLEEVTDTDINSKEDHLEKKLEEQRLISEALGLEID